VCLYTAEIEKQISNIWSFWGW